METIKKYKYILGSLVFFIVVNMSAALVTSDFGRNFGFEFGPYFQIKFYLASLVGPVLLLGKGIYENQARLLSIIFLVLIPISPLLILILTIIIDGIITGDWNISMN